MYLTVRGIVLRVMDYNDRDALLTVLTDTHGKLTIKARGLRGKNSPLVAPCQLLAYGEFTLFEYHDRYMINEAQAIELFRDLRRDITALALGSYFAQVTEIISQEDMPSPEILSLLLNCLHALSVLKIPQEKIKAVFELRAACLAGYFPDLTGCHVCGEEYPDRFDLSEGHLECGKCYGPDGGIRMPVTPGMVDAMRFICMCGPKRLFSFRLNDTKALSSLTEAYLATQLERSFSTLSFYKSLFVAPDFEE